MIEGELRDRIDELESEVYTLEIKIEELEEKLIKMFLNDK